MPDRPSFLGRIAAAMRGSIPEADVRAGLVAGGGAIDELFAADGVRNELVLAGISPWAASPSESSRLLCAWVAYALQSTAQALVDAEAPPGDHGGAGFVSPITAQQVAMLGPQVPAWIARARRAAADPGYDVAREVPLPTPWPGWVQVEPCPSSHLAAMRSAGGEMLDHLQTSLADVERAVDDQHRGPLSQLRGIVAEVDGLLASATLTPAVPVGGNSHQATEDVLRFGVERCFVLGQIMARPLLLRRPGVLQPAPAPGPPPAWGPQPPPAPWGQGGYDDGYGYGYGHGGHHGHHGHHDD